MLFFSCFPYKCPALEGALYMEGEFYPPVCLYLATISFVIDSRAHICLGLQVLLGELIRKLFILLAQEVIPGECTVIQYLPFRRYKSHIVLGMGGGYCK